MAEVDTGRIFSHLSVHYHYDTIFKIDRSDEVTSNLQSTNTENESISKCETPCVYKLNLKRKILIKDTGFFREEGCGL